MFVSQLGTDIQDDAATPAQRERMRWIVGQMKAIAESIRQAQARNDTATVRSLQTLSRKLKDELIALQKAVSGQALRQVQGAESGVFDTVGEKLARTVRTYALWGAVGIGLAIILPPLLQGAVMRRSNRRR
jgi:uncharacterized protein YlxW (UPF0749 family)